MLKDSYEIGEMSEFAIKKLEGLPLPRVLLGVNTNAGPEKISNPLSTI